MAFADELAALKSKLDAKGVPIAAVMERAGVARTTWTRWNNGSTEGPHLTTWEKVQSSAEALIAAAPRARRKAAA